MKVDLHPGFILHRRPYRETSMLLDVFSRDYGRVGLIAKGAKRKHSVVAGLLQPFQRLQIAWSGKGELMTMTAVEPDTIAYSLKNKKFIAGFYVNELIIRMLHQHEAHMDLFFAYDATLSALADPERNEQETLRIFEKRLLKSIGYGLVLDHDVQSGCVIELDSEYYYRADQGPIQNTPATSDYIRISGQTLSAIDKECMNTEKILREAKQLMRYVLQKHLGSRPLASKKLYQSYVANLPEL